MQPHIMSCSCHVPPKTLQDQQKFSNKEPQVPSFPHDLNRSNAPCLHDLNTSATLVSRDQIVELSNYYKLCNFSANVSH